MQSLVTWDVPSVAFRATLWPTAVTVPALAILIALGGWQLYRMQWKAALINEMQIRGRGPTIQLPVDSRIAPADLLNRPVRVTGRYIHDAESYLLNRVRDGTPGVDVITPFVRADGGPTLMVNRGWAPFDWPDGKDRAAAVVDQEVEVMGIVRVPGSPGWLTPQNRPDKNEWYYLDLSAMAGSVGVLPFVDYYIFAIGEVPLASEREAEKASVGEGGDSGAGAARSLPARTYPVPNTWRTDLPNNHLSYAITWFALAAALLAVYFVYHLRLSPDNQTDGSG